MLWISVELGVSNGSIAIGVFDLYLTRDIVPAPDRMSGIETGKVCRSVKS